MATSGKDKDAPPAIHAPRPDLSLTVSAQRVTSVVLNGKNFHAWSNSFRLFLGESVRLGGYLARRSHRPNPIPSMKNGILIIVSF